MISRGIHEFISLGINLQSLTNSNSLRLSWRIEHNREIRCRGRIMVENFVEMNSNNSIRSVVYKGRILLHTHLNKMELQKG
jgi:hypothetical protein